jgi:luciferase family oxidoreductase group 1
MKPPVPFSVLDLAPVSEGVSIGDSLRRSIELARRVEELGFKRFWLAEHHAMPTIASAAPDLLAGQVAAATSRIRVGSGGIMLPNHAPLMVAERFGTLEALFPGRVDLGVGRAPGSDRLTAFALRRPNDPRDAGDLAAQLDELESFFSGRWPEGARCARPAITTPTSKHTSSGRVLPVFGAQLAALRAPAVPRSAAEPRERPIDGRSCASTSRSLSTRGSGRTSPSRARGAFGRGRLSGVAG